MDPSFAILVDAALKGMAVLLLAAMLALAMRRHAAAARHLVWTAAVVGVLLLPLLSWTLPGLNVLPEAVMVQMGGQPAPPDEPASRESVTADAEPSNTITGQRPPDAATSSDDMQVPPSDVVRPDEAPQPPAMSESMPDRADATGVASEDDAERESAASIAADQGPSPWETWLAWLPWIWLGGATFALLPIALGCLGLWRLRRRSEPVADQAWLNLLHQLQEELDLRRRVELRRADRPTMPMTWGVFAGLLPRMPARILLPSDADAWSADRRRVVLLHELAHVKRYDCLTQMLAQFACALYWFNPLIWLASHRMLIERERACDDRVLLHETKPATYAEHLLEIAAGPQPGLFTPHAGAIAMARKTSLESRLYAILDKHRTRRSMTRLSATLTIALLGAVTIPLAMLQAEQAEAPEANDAPPRLSAGDVIEVRVPSGAAIGHEDRILQQVDAQGRVSLPRVRGWIDVNGLTAEEAREAIAEVMQAQHVSGHALLRVRMSDQLPPEDIENVQVREPDEVAAPEDLPPLVVDVHEGDLRVQRNAVTVVVREGHVEVTDTWGTHRGGRHASVDGPYRAIADHGLLLLTSPSGPATVDVHDGRVRLRAGDRQVLADTLQLRREDDQWIAEDPDSGRALEQEAQPMVHGDLTLGPLQEATLPADQPGFFSFTEERFVEMDQFEGDMAEQIEHHRNLGVDLVAHPEPGLTGVTAMEMVLLPTDDQMMEQVAELHEGLVQRLVVAEPGTFNFMHAEPPRPHLFRTRDGVIGVLRIRDVADDPPDITIEYRIADRPENDHDAADDRDDAAPPEAGADPLERTDDDAVLEVGDVLEVHVFELIQPRRMYRDDHVIDSDGRIDLPVLGRVEAEGVTAGKLERKVKRLLDEGDVLRDASVSVFSRRELEATDRLNALREQRATLRRQLRPEHREVQRIDQQIAQAEAAIAADGRDEAAPPEAGREESVERAIARAEELVDALRVGRFDEARQHFDDRMRAALSAQQLQDLWTQLDEVGGSFEKRGTPRHQREAGHDAIYVPLQWERNAIDLKVVFDDENQVAGLWTLPPENDAPESGEQADAAAQTTPRTHSGRPPSHPLEGVAFPLTVDDEPSAALLGFRRARSRPEQRGIHQPERYQGWWRPDGGRRPEPYPEPAHIGGLPGADHKLIEAAVAVASPDAEVAVRVRDDVDAWYLPRPAGTRGEPQVERATFSHASHVFHGDLPTLRAFRVALRDPDQQSIDLELGVAGDKWQDMARWEFPWEQPAAANGELPEDLAISQPQRWPAGDRQAVQIDLRHEPGQAASRLAVIDTDGRTRVGFRQDPSLMSRQYIFLDLTVEQIDAIVLQTQPYRWFKFRNVSVQPGHETEVEVTRADEDFQGEGRDGNGASADVAPPVPAFGDVIERVIEEWGEGEPGGSFLDLDTGEQPVPDLEYEGEQQTYEEWARRAGIDLRRRPGEREFALATYDLVAVPADQPEWNAAAESLATHWIDWLSEQTPATFGWLTVPDEPPVMYYFRTRAGSIGLLQITGFTDTGGVEIRYKLVEGVNEAPPPGRGAATGTGQARDRHSGGSELLADVEEPVRARIQNQARPRAPDDERDDDWLWLDEVADEDEPAHYAWNVEAQDGLRILHGWISYRDDNTVTEHVGSGSFQVGENARASIVLDLQEEDGRLSLTGGRREPIDDPDLIEQLGEDAAPMNVQTVSSAVVRPEGARLRMRTLPGRITFVLGDAAYYTLWEGQWVRDDEVVGTIRYAARPVPADDANSQFFANQQEQPRPVRGLPERMLRPAAEPSEESVQTLQDRLDRLDARRERVEQLMEAGRASPADLAQVRGELLEVQIELAERHEDRDEVADLLHELIAVREQEVEHAERLQDIGRLDAAGMVPYHEALLEAKLRLADYEDDPEQAIALLERLHRVQHQAMSTAVALHDEGRIGEDELRDLARRRQQTMGRMLRRQFPELHPPPAAPLEDGEAWTPQHHAEHAPRLGETVLDPAVIHPDSSEHPDGGLQFRIIPTGDTFVEIMREMGLIAPDNPDASLDAARQRIAEHGVTSARPPGATRLSAWLPVKEGAALPDEHGIITAEHEGTTYVLTATREPLLMRSYVAGEQQWAVVKVDRTEDARGQPALRFTLDEAGADQMPTFTKANLGRPMAVVLDGHVVSAPILQGRIAGEGQITGRFTDEQLTSLETRLQHLNTHDPNRNR